MSREGPPGRPWRGARGRGPGRPGGPRGGGTVGRGRGDPWRTQNSESEIRIPWSVLIRICQPPPCVFLVTPPHTQPRVKGSGNSSGSPVVRLTTLQPPPVPRFRSHPPPLRHGGLAPLRPWAAKGHAVGQGLQDPLPIPGGHRHRDAGPPRGEWTASAADRKPPVTNRSIDLSFGPSDFNNARHPNRPLIKNFRGPNRSYRMRNRDQQRL